MFNRAVLPILKQRSPAIPRQLVYASTQIRCYAKNRKSTDYPLPSSASRPGWQETEHGSSNRPSSTPLRSIKASPNERIVPQPTQQASTLKSPVAGTNAVNASKGTHSGKPTSETEIPKPEISGQPSPASSGAEAKGAENQAMPGEQYTQPLPDLTKGIPSTLENELRQAQKGQNEIEDKMNITKDPEDPPPGPKGRGTGELPHSAYISSSDRRRSTAIRIVYLGLTAGATAYLLYLARNWDTEEEARQHSDAPDGYSPGAMYNRIRARFGTTVSYYSDPVTAKLLPDEETDPNLRRPFVLVLSLEDLLIHSEWSRQNGYRIAKRPGVDYFVRYLSQYYELVLFTSQPSYIAEQIWKKLDPYSIIRFPLFREHTLYKDGGYVKDLSYLNRDLKKVIVMDTDSHHVKNQPENAIILPKWNGDPNDQTLIQFIPFLEYTATMGIDDARQVLKTFEGKYIPVEFARREKLMREKYEKEQGGKGRPRAGKGFGLGSLLGASQQQQGLGGGLSEGKMLWDQIREQGQKQYEEFAKMIQEEGPKWLAEQEAMDKQAQEEFKQSMKSGMFGWFGSSQPASQDKK